MASAAIAPAANTAANSGFAMTQGNGEKTLALQGGSTLHIYNDGKMAMESLYGRAVMASDGQVLHALDGTSITMKGDEVARLSNEIRMRNHR